MQLKCAMKIALSAFICVYLWPISFSRADALTHEQKLAAAQQVYDRLVQAIGDSRPPPRLRLRSSVQVAVFWPDRHEIDLDERMFDLCGTMPDADAALAALLGHELAHYYGHHGWTHEFGNSIPADLGQQLKVLDSQDRLRCEMEADYFGGYYGYLAGFDTLDQFPKLIEAIYRRYQSMPGYPSLQEREGIAREAQGKLSRLVPVFEAGNELLALRQYQAAALCFDFIARDFPSREILNNAGVARAQEAMELLRGDADLSRFVYPFELDADTRLRRDEVEARGLDDQTRRKAYQLLIDAERCFDEAKTRDPDYAPAYVNLAGVYDLLGKENLAAAFAEEAYRVAADAKDAASAADAQVMLGIVDARQNKIREATEAFTKAQPAAAELARINLDVLAGHPVPSGHAPATTQPDESIANATATDAKPMDDPPYDTISLTSLSADVPDITIRSKQTDAWQGYRIDIGDRWVVAYCTRRGYAGRTSRGLAVGDDLQKVLAIYGQPTDVTAGRQAILYRFDAARIILQVGSDQKVRGWTIYSLH